MSAKTKSKAVTKTGKTSPRTKSEKELPNLAVKVPKRKNGTEISVLENAQEPLRIPEELIDFCPFNYRTYIDPVKLAELAESIRLYDIIEPVTLRAVPGGRYQCCFGERRTRAGRLAGLTSIPSIIRVLTDEEVLDRQFAENMEREDPHPMEEAQGFARMKDFGKSIAEISARIGRNKEFVYGRLKLMKLVENVREMFFTNRFTLLEAQDIATLSPDSQNHFYNTFCLAWKDSEKLPFNNLKKILSSYICNLKEAPFDTEDALLVPEMNKCSICCYNTANAESLFPAEETTAFCTRRTCFEQKKSTSLANTIGNLILANGVTDIIHQGSLDEDVIEALKQIPGGSEIPTFEEDDVTEIKIPQKPTIEEYTEEVYEGEEQIENEEDEPAESNSYENDDDPDDGEDNEFNNDEDDDDFDDEDGEDDYDAKPAARLVKCGPDGQELKKTTVFDEAGYNLAIEEYEQENEKFLSNIATQDTFCGIKFGYHHRISIVRFKKEPRPTYSNNYNAHKPITAKEVQQAIKAGTVTPELLEKEIERLKSREERSQELDREKIQKKIHPAFKAYTTNSETVFNLHEADMVAMRWIVYEALTYDGRRIVEDHIFPDREDRPEKVELYEKFRDITESQFIYLIRMVILGHSGSQTADSDSGQLLYKIAEQCIDTLSIEDEQREKAEARQVNVDARITLVKKKLRKLKPHDPSNIPAWVEDYAVTDCDSLQEFFDKYRHVAQLNEKGPEYVANIMQQHEKDIELKGYTSIIADDNILGKHLTYIPGF